MAVVITRQGVFLEPIFAILSSHCSAGETSHLKRIRNWGRKMWNYAKFVALAMSASAGMLTYWIEPVETFGRMQRTSPARQPNNAALNASETRGEA
jgi:hypothetical protein